LSKIKITLTHYKNILVKVKAKNNAILNDKSLYASPLVYTVDEIKKHLRRMGHEMPHSFSHLYTLNLYENTKYKAQNPVKTADGATIDISVGYFVDYGLALEETTPRNVSIKELAKWRDTKQIEGSINLRKLQAKLKTNPDSYPIIMDAFDKTKDLYVSGVIANVSKRWFER